jgi:hypothetical protein
MFDTGKFENFVSNVPLGEKFTATKDNLAQLNIITDNLDKLQNGDKFEVSVLDENCQNTIRTAKLEWPGNAPKQFSLFSFEPIPDSKGKTYCMKLLYVSSEKRKDPPKVQKMSHIGDSNYQYLNLKNGEIIPEQEFIFRPAYKLNSAKDTLSELVRRMSAYKASYLKDDFLIVIFIGFLLSSLAVMLLLIFTSDDK